MKLFTIGYEQRSPEQFFELLQARGVEVLVDVRLTPISRKRGFSKSALRAACEARGIRYEHRRELGNPKVHRVEAQSVDECLGMFASYMGPRWESALGDLPARASEQATALLCMERDGRCCHRTIVASALVERLPGVEVVAL